MKAIMMSIKPKYVKEILNGNKTIEIRKRFPKDYVGWVYIYCTKDKKYANLINRGGFLTGMVVARFWCNKVSPTYDFYEEEICDLACITKQEYLDYFGYDDGYAIHITKLEIFDKPKEIIEFEREIGRDENVIAYDRLNRAPQSWCYIEE